MPDQSFEQRFDRVEKSLQQILDMLQARARSERSSLTEHASEQPNASSDDAAEGARSWGKLSKAAASTESRGEADSSNAWTILRGATRVHDNGGSAELTEARRAVETAALNYERGNSSDSLSGVERPCKKIDGRLACGCRAVSVWMPWERSMVWSDILALAAVLFIGPSSGLKPAHTP